MIASLILPEVSLESFFCFSSKQTGANSYEKLSAIVERCQDTGFYVGFIPGLQGAHTQAETLDELNQNLRKLLKCCLKQDWDEVRTPTVC
jgi:predicted RNase H-like HicB family nuclease